MLSAPAQVYALGDLSEPVTQYEPIGQELFPTVDAAIDFAKRRGWQVLRVEK